MQIDLYNTNCMSYMCGLDNNSIELTVTDIPYDVVNRSSNGLRNLDKSSADISTFPVNSFVNEVCRITKGSVYIFCATEQISEIRKTMVDNGLSTRVIVWQKSNPSPMNGQYIWLSGVELCCFGKKRGGAIQWFLQEYRAEIPFRQKQTASYAKAC